MNNIEINTLKKWREDYTSNKINLIAQHALIKNPIDNVVIVPEVISSMTHQFSISLNTLPATNQKASGRCWIFAGCNIIRETIAKKYNLSDFEISQNYISFFDKLEKANYFMEMLIQLSDSEIDDRIRHLKLTSGIEDGGQWDMFVHIVKKYGIVPKNVMPETYHSSNTMQINRLINTKLRQFAYFVKEKRINIEALKDETLRDIYVILVDCFGMPPETFSFEYVDKNKQYHSIKDLTPLSFYERYSDINLDDYVSIINAPTNDKPYYHLFTVKYLDNVIEMNGCRYLNLPLKEFKQVIINQLKSLEPVWFGSDCNKAFDRESAIWDDKLLDYDTTFGMVFSMSKRERLETLESSMNHAMVLTGVNLESDIPTKWKIENSWGDDKGNKGYYTAADTWFDEFVYQAVIHKKHLTAEQAQALKSKPIELMPWDPFGSLAKK